MPGLSKQSVFACVAVYVISHMSYHARNILG